MEQDILYAFLGSDKRMEWAKQELWAAGYDTVLWPDGNFTHLVLPLPAFDGDDIRGGPALSRLLPTIGPGITVLGGKLGHRQALLESTGATVMDYYLDEELTAANAAITAEGAVSLAMSKLQVTLWGCPVLVCGWGRIGQLLAHKLRALGARVTVSARKARDLGLIEALGFCPVVTGETSRLGAYRVIFNTIPAKVYSRRELLLTREDCLLLELASQPGLEDSPQRPVISAAGLPGICAPESAGRLIGQTILRLTVERS